MKKIISSLLILFVCFGMVLTEAQAKRFGGGRSFGVSRSASTFSSARPLSSPMQNTASPNRNRWLGPLAGLAAGGLLASLFMGNGIASGMMSWLLIGGVVLLLLNLVRGFSRQNAAAHPHSNTHNMFQGNAAREHSSQQWFNQSSSAPLNARTYPANFDESDFLRKAKVQFIRLQAAYDQKNLQDIRLFTSPDVFAEIKMQLQERGNQENLTDVVALNAELLDVSTEYQDAVASVKFSGLIKEDVNAAANSFSEIWHFRKPAESDQWVTEGIQQH